MNRFGDAGACFRRRVFTELGVRYDERLRSFEDWGCGSTSTGPACAASPSRACSTTIASAPTRWCGASAGRDCTPPWGS